MNGEISEALSEYAVSVELEALSPTERAHLEDAFVNWVGCAYGGARKSTVDAAARAFLEMSPNGTHEAFGREERFNLVDAVSIDCLSSAVQAFDDIHLETTLHPTGPVAAAAFGMARTRKVSGADYLTALHVGMEIECRVALALASAGSGAKGGWYWTGIAGGVGGAAACGRLFGFDNEQMKSAIGMAAGRASGTRGTHGSMAAAYVPSMAAESGVISAMLTRSGLLCGARALDGPSGLIDLITTEPRIDRALQGLGEVSEAARTSFKPYPSGFVTHPVIDACFELMSAHAVRSDEIEQLTFAVSPTAHQLVANKLPSNEVEAQISLYFWAAVTLQFGAAGVAQLSPENIADPALRAFQDRITATISEDLADDQCTATARLTNGKTVEVRVEHALGSVYRPMTRSDVDRKFMTLVGPALSEEGAGRLLAQCRSVSTLDDVTSILSMGNGATHKPSTRLAKGSRH